MPTRTGATIRSGETSMVGGLPLRVAVPVVLGLLAVLMMHHPMLLGGMAAVQVDAGDTRLNNYILEHGYRFLIGDAAHACLWDMDIFHPVRGTGAYSDVLFAAGPPYWLFRSIGMAPDTAFQWWMITMTALNFACFLLFLRRVFGVGIVAASLGAAFFAAALPRLAHLGHQALLGQVFVVLALTALGALFVAPPAQGRPGPEQGGAGGRRGWIALFFAACAAQVYYGFYNAFFLSLLLLLAALLAGFFPSLRRRAGWLLSHHALLIAVAGLLAALLLVPVARAYLGVRDDVGVRTWREVEPMLPRPVSWLYVDDQSLVYRHLPETALFDDLPLRNEHLLGMGLLAPLVALSGLLGSARRPGVRLLLIALLVVIPSVTVLFGKAPVWRGIFNYYPAGDAIRAVSRIGLWLLVPAAVGLALFANGGGRRRAVWRTLLVLLCLLEQVGETGTFDKEALRREDRRIEASIRPGCQAFFVTEHGGRAPFWQIHVSAMWAGMHAGIPTVNGYSGHWPPGYDLHEVQQPDREAEGEVEDRLRAWLERHGRRREDVCWIQLDGRARKD